MKALNRTVIIASFKEEKDGLDLDGMSDNRFQKGIVYESCEDSLVNKGDIVLYDTASEAPATYKDVDYVVIGEHDIKWVERDS